jgi:hypothetical protein
LQGTCPKLSLGDSTWLCQLLPAPDGAALPPRRNFGDVFIIWDRLFGTFQEERPDRAPVFGLNSQVWLCCSEGLVPAESL